AIVPTTGSTSEEDLFSMAELVLAGVWREKLDEFRRRPMPRVTRLSSIRLQSRTQSFFNCFVQMAYRNGLAQELSGRMKTVKTFASFSEMSSKPKTAVREKKAIGAQQQKSVNTSSAIRFAILLSLLFHACEPRMAQYMRR